jgi:hypothetical protein
MYGYVGMDVYVCRWVMNVYIRRRSMYVCMGMDVYVCRWVYVCMGI